MKPFQPARRRISAFTLVELLVVIGIIALLIAVLAPTLSRARRHANTLTCTSNLRQWAAAALMYAEQNHGSLARRGNGQNGSPLPADVQRPADWFNGLPPLLRAKTYGELANAGAVPRPQDQSIWTCPEAIDNSGVNTAGAARNFFSYGMNMGLSTTFDFYPSNLARVGSWTTMVLMSDSAGWNNSVWPNSTNLPANPAVRHGGRVNIAFLDGHVASFTGNEIGVGVGVPKRADLRWWSPDSKWPGVQ